MPANKVDHDDGEYKGEPVDEKLENGPMEERSCTDILCCLLFIAFLGGMLGIASYSISRGNPSIIGRGYDLDNNICGVSPGYEAYPYLYFTIPKSPYLQQTVCVAQCPTDPPTTNFVQCKPNSLYPTQGSCSGPRTHSEIAVQMATQSSLTGKFWIYETAPYFSRYCAPQAGLSFAQDAANAAFSSDLLDQWFSDVKTAWPVIAVSCAVAFVLGFIYMILLRWCAGVLTWVSIFGFIAGTAILGWRFFQNAQDLKSANSNTASSTTGNASENYNSQLVIAYICWGVSGLTCLSVLCLWNRIALAVAIIKAASDYVRATLSVFLIPPVICVILAAWYIWWTITAVYLVSTGQTTRLGNTPIASISFDTQLKKLMVYQLLGLLWVNAFVLASTQFIIASSTALWYFSQGTGQLINATITKSVYRLFRYHFGSIAFGSLLLALVQLVRIILAYFQQQAKKMQGRESRVMKFMFNCLQCYLACFERFIKFLNKNAYIQIALTGKNFCLAAKDGFFLVIRNPLRMGALASIGGIFILFGKFCICVVTSVGAFLYITKSSTYANQIYSPFIPVLLVAAFSYAIAAVFMTIYGLAADTILACFILDEELMKKKNAPARHCPQSLKSFIDKHGKKN